MDESLDKQKRDILAMKRVAREIFYPMSESEFINDAPISDEAFIPDHIKEEGRILLDDPVTHMKPIYEESDVEAFLPEISQLGDASLAKDVFFPEVKKYKYSPKFLSNYYQELEQLTKECQSAINAGQISYAKKLYNEARVTFISSHMEGEDREKMYELIQSLFDQINLKKLEEEAIKRLQ